MSVEKLWDETWIGVKCQSNAEIAGSPRNSFRASLKRRTGRGRALNELGAVRLPNSIKLRMRPVKLGSQTASAKIRSQEGNSPDHQLRSPMPC